MKKSELKALVKEVIKESMVASELFFWDSSLSNSRKQQILQWVNSLPKEHQKMIEEIHSEGWQDGSWNESQRDNEDS